MVWMAFSCCRSEIEKQSWNDPFSFPGQEMILHNVQLHLLSSVKWWCQWLNILHEWQEIVQQSDKSALMVCDHTALLDIDYSFVKFHPLEKYQSSRELAQIVQLQHFNWNSLCPSSQPFVGISSDPCGTGARAWSERVLRVLESHLLSNGCTLLSLCSSSAIHGNIRIRCPFDVYVAQWVQLPSCTV